MGTEKGTIFTYEDQPGNLDAWRIGECAYGAVRKPGGDLIDTGLQLMLELQERGFGIVKL